MSSNLKIPDDFARLKRRQAQLFVAFVVSAALFTTILSWQQLRLNALEKRDHLTLRRLDIVDDKGVSRVILAAPVPPPIHFGKVLRRDGPASGILLVDATNTERGGYVTGDGDEPNALLTLDAQDRQTMLMLAEPGGSTLFRLWNQQRGSIVMGVADNPFLNVNAMGMALFTEPENNPQSKSEKRLYR